MDTFFAYARVSTPRQGERGVSLPEQKNAIERYAKSHGLKISRWFEEQQSASHTGRPTFVQMLRLLRRGAAQGVIIHKIDRSARNLEDWADVGKLVDLGVEVHFANENVDLKTVAGRLSADIQAVVAAHYSRNLREEVKKGLYGRLKQGYYPFRAPIGYLDQGAAKPKTLDPQRAPLLQEAFKLYSTGKFSLPQLAKEMFHRGLRNHNSCQVTVNGLVTILKNPFYIGLMRIYRAGQTFNGCHEPLITTQMFEEVQEVLTGKRVDRPNSYVFIYSRLLRCATCGYSLVGERQKGHIYYRCHDRPFKNPPKCPATSIREENLNHAIVNALTDVDLSDEELKLARLVLDEQRREFENNHTAVAHAAKLQVDQVQYRLAKLADLLIDGTIDKSVYEEKQRSILLEQAKAKERLTEIENGRSSITEELERTVELAKSPSLLYKKASAEKKRELCKVLLSNLSVFGKNVEITLAMPFRLISEREKATTGGAYRGSCRTWKQIINKLVGHFNNQRMLAN